MFLCAATADGFHSLSSYQVLNDRKVTEHLHSHDITKYDGCMTGIGLSITLMKYAEKSNPGNVIFYCCTFVLVC